MYLLNIKDSSNNINKINKNENVLPKLKLAYFQKRVNISSQSLRFLKR
ncbi:hypothetical protein STRIC_2277 [Streptococcus ictaluri 707-05]|uniref:Uncharacterized protein n=1 Tax=Streptococcus ictaluri 707-05 TaxID=764299 RepID=G5K1M0_9STRE|nr:hypothetical protein STRIC_2277 [Streptococcus ictaluri 707-05]